MKIRVDTNEQTLRMGVLECTCAIGKNGAIAQEDGREGDGKTPLGTYQVRYGLYRADRLTLPPNKLTFWHIHRDDGWCDAPENTAYNRPVSLPYPSSAEKLWRASNVYDVVIVLGHNDSPPEPNMGSAVFLHIAREGYAPTLGCIAVSIENMLTLITVLDNSSEIEIT